MASLPKALPKDAVDDSSIPNRMVIDFLEGTLRKKDAIAFARGFIEHHFDSLTASGYFVMPYEQGYIFEAQEGGPQKAYLPSIMKALEEDPAASACVQMARRIIEVKRSPSGTYTAVLLPEGTESQNENIVFPQPAAKLIPFKRSGMSMLYAGLSVASIGLIIFVLSLLFWLVEVTGLMSPALPTINLGSLPLTQWQSLESIGGGKSDSYVKTLRYENNLWKEDKAARQQFSGATPDAVVTPQLDLNGLPPGIQPAAGPTPDPSKNTMQPPANLPANPLPGNPMKNIPNLAPAGAPPGMPTTGMPPATANRLPLPVPTAPATTH